MNLTSPLELRPYHYRFENNFSSHAANDAKLNSFDIIKVINDQDNLR